MLHASTNEWFIVILGKARTCDKPTCALKIVTDMCMFSQEWDWKGSQRTSPAFSYEWNSKGLQRTTSVYECIECCRVWDSWILSNENCIFSDFEILEISIFFNKFNTMFYH